MLIFTPYHIESILDAAKAMVKLPANRHRLHHLHISRVDINHDTAVLHIIFISEQRRVIFTPAYDKGVVMVDLTDFGSC